MTRKNSVWFFRTKSNLSRRIWQDRMTRPDKRKITTPVLVLLLTFSSSFSGAPQQWANGEEGYVYVQAFIDSLGWAKSGLSRLPEKQDKSDDLGAFTETLYNLKLA